VTPEILLHELGDPVHAVLTLQQADAVARQRIATVVPLGGEHWSLTPGTKVGVCTIGDTVVRVVPKIEISRVFYLLGYAAKPGWRPETVPFETVDDLVTALAYAFAMQAERAIEQGLMQGYVEVDDALPVLRGRMRDSEQLTRRFGLAVPLLVRFDDYTTDIAENRLLKAATERLLSLPGITPKARQQLRGLRVLFGDIGSLRRGMPLPVWRPNRLNSRYQVALWLADVVLRNNSLDHSAGDMQANGFMLDMAKLFEDFVSRRLGDALAAIDGTMRVQDHWLLDVEGQVKIRPDLVWYDKDGNPQAVIDAKYKAEKPAGFPNADIYQLLAYCTALQLRVGHLIYAKGNGAASVATIRNVGVRVVAHAVDLSALPTDLERQIDEVADQISAETVRSSAVDTAALALFSLGANRPTQG
jgi:5-methylcytosine-specific restriction enzyme subunit McrC